MASHSAGGDEFVLQIRGSNYRTPGKVIFSINQSNTSYSDINVDELVHSWIKFFSSPSILALPGTYARSANHGKVLVAQIRLI